MIITHYALDYKNRILQTFLILALGLFCYAFARNITTINNDITPLSGGNVEAMFYIENPDTGSMTCIGDGLINSTEEITNNIVTVTQNIISAPNYSAITGNSLTVVWHSIRRSEGEIRVYGMLSPNDGTSISTIFSSVEEMKSANVSLGDTVSTLGFYSANDGGGALYTITKTPQTAVNPYTTFQLNNGLYAELSFDSNSIIPINSVGITNDTEIAHQLNELFSILDNKVSGFSFNNGTYYIEEPVYLRSFKYFGNNTLLKVSNTFNPKESNVLLTLKQNTRPYDIELHDLNILFEANTHSSLINTTPTLLCLRYINSCTIDNCNITAKPSNVNGTFIPVNLLWFKQTTLMQNINISNCKLYNYSAMNYTGDVSDNLGGGSLWFSGPSNDYTRNFNSINVTGCDIQTTVNDEALALWNGNFSNVSFYDCNISNSVHPSNNLITFFQGSFNNLSLNNCSIITNVPTRNVIKYRLLTEQSNIIFNNCAISLDKGHSQYSSSLMSLFKCESDMLEYDGTTSVEFNDCTLESADGTIYNTYFRYHDVDNKQIILNDFKLLNSQTVSNDIYITNSLNIDILMNDCEGISPNSINQSNSNSVSIVNVK